MPPALHRHRRAATVCAIALITGLAAGTSSVVASNRPRSSGSLEGGWRARVTFTTGPLKGVPFQFLLTYAAGNGMVESSNLDESPPVPPAYGTWQQTGRHTYKNTYVFWTTKIANPHDLTQGWTFAGSGLLTEKITLANAGNAYESTITYRLYDATDKPLPGQSGTGHASARRITIR